MKVLFIADVFSGCTWYRCVVPGHALAEAGHEARLRITAASKSDVDWCDVLVMQRMWHEDATRAALTVKARGGLTIYDIDDDLWSIGPENSAQDFWEHHKADAVDVLRVCDRVTTTGTEIAGLLRRFHSDVRIVPNALPDDWERVPDGHTHLRIGWSGGNSHKEDVQSVASVLYEVLDARPEVTLAVVGDAGKWLEPHPQLEVFDYETIEVYHTIPSRFDIGIAPLTDNRFNRCKSDLKPLEYAGCGIPWVASRVGPYAEIPSGNGGFTAKHDRDWKRYLLRLIDDPALRSEMGEAAHRWADTRRISKLLPRWEQAMT